MRSLCSVLAPGKGLSLEACLLFPGAEGWQFHASSCRSGADPCPSLSCQVDTCGVSE